MMASSLKDRMKKEVSPASSVVLDIAGKTEAKKKYPVNVVFDGALEEAIRQRAKERGVGVATYIKMLVAEDFKKSN